MKIKDKTYWIVYSRIKKKYPYLPIKILHMFTRKAIEKRRRNKESRQKLQLTI